MALTEERKASLLAYCKLTELADDPEVQVLIPALYDLVVDALVLDGWERREATITSTTVTDNPVFRRRLNQLKWTG